MILSNFTESILHRRAEKSTTAVFQAKKMQKNHLVLLFSDVPVTDVPIAALLSWSNFLQFDVANAAAYILVYDVTAQFHSFDFVRTIREQLINHPSTAGGLIFVAGNKVDLPYQLNRCDIMHVVGNKANQGQPALAVCVTACPRCVNDQQTTNFTLVFEAPN